MENQVKVINNSDRKYLPKKLLEKASKIVLKNENINNAYVLIILTDNDYIRELNRRFLRHNYATDVLAFSLEEDRIEGEIYISVDKAIEQAKEYKVTMKNELMRLTIHGTLHLVGYQDDTPENKKIMYEKEEYYLSQALYAGKNY